MIKTLPFIGKWRGQGVVYPSGSYEEELKIKLFGTPGGTQLTYISKTWLPGTSYNDSPLHTESGMLKLIQIDESSANLELLLSHPFGLTEIEAGEYSENSMRLQTINISRTPSSTNNIVQCVRRHFWLEGDKLRYNLFLTTEGSAEYLHLDAQLSRVVKP